jgi:Zn-dependent peptidase ImmA (M78 family)
MRSTRVGESEPKQARLIKRLRALSPAWAVTRREARWIAEQQAKLLLADAGITAPPVSERIVTALAGINVYPLTQIPVQGLLGASKPNGRGGDILIDDTLPMPDRRVTLLHELKHIIDGGHATKLHQRGSESSGEALCTDFAMSVLMPAPWLGADWQAGHRNIGALAHRYQVPTEAVEHRLHTLGLQKHTRRHRRRPFCHWQPHPATTDRRTR